MKNIDNTRAMAWYCPDMAGRVPRSVPGEWRGTGLRGEQHAEQQRCRHGRAFHGIPPFSR
jgi:hypothetical protein